MPTKKQNDGLVDDDNTILMSYSIVFDNANQKTNARHQSETIKWWTWRRRAPLDRIVSLHFPSEQPAPSDALDIPVASHCCNIQDVGTSVMEFRNKIGKVLHRFFSFLPANLPEGEKPFHTESDRHSIMIHLCVLKENEANIEGRWLTSCLTDMCQCVQMVAHLFCLCGAMVSVVSSHDAHALTFNGSYKLTRLAGLSPSVQEWHHKPQTASNGAIVEVEELKQGIGTGVSKIAWMPVQNLPTLCWLDTCMEQQCLLWRSSI